MGFITYPVLTFDQRVRKNKYKYIFFKKIELGAWVGSCHCAFSTHMLEIHVTFWFGK
jgi:hypothetical protein